MFLQRASAAVALGWSRRTSWKVGALTTTSAFLCYHSYTGNLSKVYAAAAKQTRAVVFAFGENQHGQLGLNRDSDGEYSPTSIDQLTGLNVVQLAAGGASSGVVTQQGEVFTWGEGLKGNLGQGHCLNIAVPTRVAALNGSKIRKLALSRTLGMVCDDQGRVFTWGSAGSSHLGRDGEALLPSLVNFPLSSTSPPPASSSSAAAATSSFSVVPPTSASSSFDGAGDVKVKIVDVSCGQAHAVAITDTGRVFSWGQGHSGALGTGNAMDQARPVEIHLPLSQPATLSSSSSSSSFASSSLSSSSSPSPAAAAAAAAAGMSASSSLPSDPVVQVACGGKFTLLLTSTGQIYGCGQDDHGQLAQGGSLSLERYVKVPRRITLGNWTEVASTTTTNNTTTASTSNAGEKKKKVISIAAGDLHAAAVTVDGTVYVWGYGKDGQIGNGDCNVHNGTPLAVHESLLQAGKGGGGGVWKVVCGGGHTAALTRDGQLFLWGRGRSGQLGNNFGSVAAYRDTPQAVNFFSSSSYSSSSSSSSSSSPSSSAAAAAAVTSTTNTGGEGTKRVLDVALGGDHSLVLAEVVD